MQCRSRPGDRRITGKHCYGEVRELLPKLRASVFAGSLKGKGRTAGISHSWYAFLFTLASIFDRDCESLQDRAENDVFPVRASYHACARGLGGKYIVDEGKR